MILFPFGYVHNSSKPFYSLITLKKSPNKKIMNNNRGKLLTPKKAKEIYGIEPTKIYNWVRNRKFRFIKPEKEILFWEKDLLDFLDRNTSPADCEEGSER